VPATSPMALALPPFEIRTIRPESRSETRASPEERKTIPHGTLRFLAIVPAIFGFGGLVGEGDRAADRVGVGVGLGDSEGVGVALDAGSVVGVVAEPAPLPSSVQPATAQMATPADPSSSVRRVITP
jgi:hypothetical protein